MEIMAGSHEAVEVDWGVVETSLFTMAFPHFFLKVRINLSRMLRMRTVLTVVS